jgi:hypothetical protein
MKPLNEGEGWACICLFVAFGMSGVLAALGLMPMWAPIVVWLIFAGILIRSQMRPPSEAGRSSDEDEGAE